MQVLKEYNVKYHIKYAQIFFLGVLNIYIFFTSG